MNLFLCLSLCMCFFSSSVNQKATAEGVFDQESSEIVCMFERVTLENFKKRDTKPTFYLADFLV